MSDDVSRTSAYMVMDASEPGKRSYWGGYGWVDDPTVSFRAIRRDYAENCYLDLINGGCQAMLALVEYSRTCGRVIVHSVIILHQTRNS